MATIRPQYGHYTAAIWPLYGPCTATIAIGLLNGHDTATIRHLFDHNILYGYAYPPALHRQTNNIRPLYGYNTETAAPYWLIMAAKNKRHFRSGHAPSINQVLTC